jgi:hypothetical protein
VHQTWLPGGIGVVNVDNCYNHITHLIALLVFQALGVPQDQEAVVLMLSIIQDMKFSLRTGFGDSKVYEGSTDGKKMQGLCQGNGAAPAGWTITSITLIQAHKWKEHSVHLLSTITKKPLHVAGGVFTDNTDLEHLGMNKLRGRS